MDQVNEFSAPVMYQPTDYRVHLSSEVPVKQTRHIRQPEALKQSTERTQERQSEETDESVMDVISRNLTSCSANCLSSGITFCPVIKSA